MLAFRTGPTTFRRGSRQMVRLESQINRPGRRGRKARARLSRLLHRYGWRP